MRMLKRLSLAVATALGICLLAPTGDAQDVSVAGSFSSTGMNLSQTSTMGLAPGTLEARINPLYASSHCCNERDRTCCPPRNPPTESDDIVSLESECFDVSLLNVVGVASPFGENPLYASSHCCNANDDSCCAPAYPEDEKEDSV